MKIFTTIREFVNYIPNCIICGKAMNIVLDMSRLNFNISKSTIFVKTKIVDNMLISKNKNHPFIINIDTNIILNGKEIFSKPNKCIYIDKYCSTCNFKLFTSHSFMDFKDSYYPIFYLYKENIYYTRKGGKSIKIDLYHTHLGEQGILTINKKDAKFSLNLDRFSNLNHLNKRISILLTFQ